MVVSPKDHTLLRTEQLILGNGSMECAMDMEHSCGQMVPATKECGKMIKQTVKESLFMLMVISMRVSGLTIKLKELALTHMQMELTTKVNGLTINNMDKELSHGLMVLGTKANMRMVKKKAKVG